MSEASHADPALVRVAVQMHPAGSAASAPANVYVLPASAALQAHFKSSPFQRKLQTCVALSIHVARMIFFILNTFYFVYYEIAFSATQVEQPVERYESKLSSSPSFYSLHQHFYEANIIQPVDSPASSFYPAVQSGNCSATCAHVLSEKLANAFERTSSSYTVNVMHGAGDEFFNEPMQVSYKEIKCSVQGSRPYAVIISCEAALWSYPQFIALIGVWGFFFTVFITHQLFPIVAFRASFDDLRLHLAIDSHQNSMASKALVGICHCCTLATFALGVSTYLSLPVPNQPLLLGSLLFLVINFISASSFSQANFSVSMGISQIKTKWPRKVQCSPPWPANQNAFSLTLNLFFDQCYYFRHLVRHSHPCNHAHLEHWGQSDDIIQVMTIIVSHECEGDHSASSKSVPFPILCKVVLTCITSAVVCYQAIVQVQQLARNHYSQVLELNDVMAVGIKFGTNEGLGMAVANLATSLPFALPGESYASLLSHDTITFSGFSSVSSCQAQHKATRRWSVVSGQSSQAIPKVVTFQMSAGMCKPIENGKSISYVPSGLLQGHAQGSLNVYNNSACKGAILQSVSLNHQSPMCIDNSLDPIIPFHEPSAPSFGKSDLSSNVQVAAFSWQVSPMVAFNDSGVRLQLGTAVFEGEPVDMGVTRHRITEDQNQTQVVFAGEQRAAACVTSQPACFPAISYLYQEHLPKTRVVQVEEIHMECFPKHPYQKYNKRTKTKSAAFTASTKYASHKVLISTVTFQCQPDAANAYLVAMSSLWALFSASVLAVLAWNTKKYSASDIRFHIALDAATFSCKSYHIRTFGIGLTLVTFLASFFYSDDIDFMNAFLFIFSGLRELNSMFDTSQSIRSYARDSSDVADNCISARNRADTVLNLTTSPVFFKLPKSHINAFELNGMIVPPAFMLQKVETSLLKDELCKTDSLSLWGNGPAIARVMQMLVKDSDPAELPVITALV